jgi:hypothetical protein
MENKYQLARLVPLDRVLPVDPQTSERKLYLPVTWNSSTRAALSSIQSIFSWPFCCALLTVADRQISAKKWPARSFYVHS